MNKIEQWMNSRIGLNFRSGLDRMEQAVSLLGRPDKAYPILHVTGTNGKGSTIAFLRQLLMAHGKKVGTFTSPHMISIHDRICIGDQPISDEDFTRIGQEVQQMEQTLLQTQDQLSYFEIICLMALLYFKEQAVDVVLLEVGIGGLLDTTNVVTGEIAVITSVGLDHQETLGGTIAAIAQQKAGIFKKGKKAVVGLLSDDAITVCQEKAKQLDVDLYAFQNDFGLEQDRFWNENVELVLPSLGLKGDYQRENAAVALEAFFLYMEGLDQEVDMEQVKHALQETRWPGRLELFGDQVYLDGAHNPHAMLRLIEFANSLAGKRVKILFGALKRKDYSGMLQTLQAGLPEAELILTTFHYGEVVAQGDRQDLPYVADYKAYIKEFMDQSHPDEVLFVTGSLYFIAEVRAFLLEG
ncbi:bifunctional folylpolyglutamate synthase/dihydrofolate synthase [Streptococcus parasanguinis]|uniref:bifunctional folylpolyglutamate synthase/dihydrofolate synthase n=1 Tax=Streptococcus parasanguinis TaxID=1318 RepID=UPI00066AFFDC|nr:folylpolyglutamate synthase/dihydrofolate synthase family protein [Streptococcus parasanguinis]MDU5787170.1 folylpolyglutamate synthase/dihydrofolate synthase family protein [Streptococcus parasanguinis]